MKGFFRQGHIVMIDEWEGHNRHDAHIISQQLLEKAEIIVCEWCAGNAVWYSKNKRPEQKLVIRFHSQERNTRFPKVAGMKEVDKMIFVGPHIRCEAVSRFGWEKWAEKKLTVIPNYVDTNHDCGLISLKQTTAPLVNLVSRITSLILAAHHIRGYQGEIVIE